MLFVFLDTKHTLCKASWCSVVTTALGSEHIYREDTLFFVIVISFIMLLNSSGVASVTYLLISCFLLELSGTYTANIEGMLLHVPEFKYLQSTKCY